jgi:non-canonical poly(A) RNA polymerase PAPD5/7
MRVGTQGNHDLRVVPRVNEYFGLMPALRPLVLVLKSFIFCKEVDSELKGGLSTYALVCMCISFLQVKPSPVYFAA